MLKVLTQNIILMHLCVFTTRVKPCVKTWRTLMDVLWTNLCMVELVCSLAVIMFSYPLEPWCLYKLTWHILPLNGNSGEGLLAQGAIFIGFEGKGHRSSRLVSIWSPGCGYPNAEKPWVPSRVALGEEEAMCETAKSRPVAQACLSVRLEGQRVSFL